MEIMIKGGFHDEGLWVSFSAEQGNTGQYCIPQWLLFVLEELDKEIKEDALSQKRKWTNSKASQSNKKGGVEVLDTVPLSEDTVYKVEAILLPNFASGSNTAVYQSRGAPTPLLTLWMLVHLCVIPWLLLICLKFLRPCVMILCWFGKPSELKQN